MSYLSTAMIEHQDERQLKKEKACLGYGSRGESVHGGGAKAWPQTTSMTAGKDG